VHGQGYPVPYYGGGSNNYHHASTVEEGAARGLADVIRSAGAANMMNSEAAKNYEDARKKYIDNRLLRTQTYFEMKQINKQARWGNQRRRSQADLIRFSKARLPDRLNHAELDPLSGDLTWPLILRMASLEPQRKKLQTLFALRARDGYVGPDQYLEIVDHVKAMMDALKDRAKDFPSKDTIAARKFLEGLGYEATFQAG
jgi:hypothetical protein